MTSVTVFDEDKLLKSWENFIIVERKVFNAEKELVQKALDNGVVHPDALRAFARVGGMNFPLNIVQRQLWDVQEKKVSFAEGVLLLKGVILEKLVALEAGPFHDGSADAVATETWAFWQRALSSSFLKIRK